MSRYIDADSNVYNMLDDIIREHFSNLANAKIKVLFDTKRRKAGDRIVLSTIKKANELVRHLTSDEDGDGCDYIMIINEKAWNICNELDRTRLLRHELRHTHVDMETNGNPYKTRDHDVQDFFEEIELNKDDIGWSNRIATIVNDMYDQEKEMENDRSNNKRKRRNGR